MIKLYVGSGDKTKEGFQSVDIYDFGTNKIWDMRLGYGPWKDEKIDDVYGENFLEHFTNDEAIKFLSDTCEVLIETNGTLKLDVPSIKREAAFEFPHKSYYKMRTFHELETEEQPIYGIKNWKIERLFMNHKDSIIVYMRPSRKPLRHRAGTPYYENINNSR